MSATRAGVPCQRIASSASSAFNLPILPMTIPASAPRLRPPRTEGLICDVSGCMSALCVGSVNEGIIISVACVDGSDVTEPVGESRGTLDAGGVGGAGCVSDELGVASGGGEGAGAGGGADEAGGAGDVLGTCSGCHDNCSVSDDPAGTGAGIGAGTNGAAFGCLAGAGFPCGFPVFGCFAGCCVSRDG